MKSSLFKLNFLKKIIFVKINAISLVYYLKLFRYFHDMLVSQIRDPSVRRNMRRDFGSTADRRLVHPSVGGGPITLYGISRLIVNQLCADLGHAAIEESLLIITVDCLFSSHSMRETDTTT